MLILAIETSCDDTCAGLSKTGGFKVNRFLLKSTSIKSGGVVPDIAKRAHQERIESE